MKVIRGIDNFSTNKPVVLTQGTFDGVHLGHQKILKKVVQRAREINGLAVLLTFFPHPRLVLYPDSNGLKLITTLEEKLKLLTGLGLDAVVVQSFDKALSRIEPQQYIENVLVKKLNAKYFIIGYDHRFGKNREGSIEDLEKHADQWDYKLEEIERQDIQESAVSSTKIRTCLELGNVKEAAKFLGRYFSFQGKVIHGKGIGKTIGFPTANLLIEEPYKILPRMGVYSGKCSIDSKIYPSMINIGNRPTFDDNTKQVEIHVLNFNEEIYDKIIKIECVKRLRDTIRFESKQALIEQLKLDKVQTESTLTPHLK